MDPEFGPAFRGLIPAQAKLNAGRFPTEFCGGDTARILVDHDAYCLTLEEAARVLTRPDPVRSKLEISGQVVADRCPMNDRPSVAHLGCQEPTQKAESHSGGPNPQT